jgi:hypothetical protein
MATTYTLISSATVGSGGQASIEFTSIPATYTDLFLKLSLRSSSSGAHNGGSQMIFNNSTAADYSFRQLRGNGTTSFTTGLSSGTNYIRVTNNHPTAGNTASTFCHSEVYIPNYTSSNFKSVLEDNVEENNTIEAYIQIVKGLWSNTSTITSIKLTSEATAFVEHSTAYLYGIKNS